MHNSAEIQLLPKIDSLFQGIKRFHGSTRICSSVLKLVGLILQLSSVSLGCFRGSSFIALDLEQLEVNRQVRQKNQKQGGKKDLPKRDSLALRH